MTSQSSFAIANYFIWKAAEEKVPLTPMKLIKLVYLAHGWSLGLTGKPLLREPIEAWKFGPVIESLYHAYKRYGNHPLPANSATRAEIQGEDAAEIKRLLDKVWNSYKKYSAAQLSTLTHQPDTPWSKVHDPNSFYTVIPDKLIAEHYQQIDERRRPAQRKRPAFAG
jgi:uncharacterized phage-associated protein